MAQPCRTYRGGKDCDLYSDGVFISFSESRKKKSEYSPYVRVHLTRTTASSDVRQTAGACAIMVGMLHHSPAADNVDTVKFRYVFQY